MHPSANRKKNEKIFIGALCLVTIAYWRRGTSVRQYIGAQMYPAPLLLAHRSTLHAHTTSVRKGFTRVGAQMYPAPLLLAHRSTLHAHTTSVRKGFTLRFFNIMYSFTSPIGGPKISVRLAYFHPNRLLTVLYKQETEIS